ncbi:MAG: AhpC/TSA family protein [Moorea sp. SIO2B7]|nr:AhpC/TSA family protein [Moorena sp. SIO2B7]
MNLTQDLINLQNQLSAKQPEEVKKVMSKATADLIHSGIIEQTLKAGDRVPNFTLPNAVGQAIKLQELLKKGAVVISFYRGGWCPYCNLELRALQQYLPEIIASGATLVAISPQTPDNSLSTAEKNNLTFEVLSDLKNQVAKQFGLVFTIPEELRPIYANFGIDLPEHNGDDNFELPIPATYVVSQNGTLVKDFVDPYYTKRLDPKEIVVTLQNLTVTL